MKGIILAAGRGNRMGKMTNEKPKCLIEINGKCLIDHQLNAFKNVGINNIALVTGYKRELLSKYGNKEFHNPKWETTNMVSSLLCADEWLISEPCIVSYSDIYYNDEALKLLLKSKFDLAITYDPSWLELWSKRFADPLEDAESFKINSKGKVLEIGKKPKTVDEIQGQYMGLFYINPKAWKELKLSRSSYNSQLRDSMHMTTLLQKVIENNMISLNGIKYEGVWSEYDTIDDLEIDL